MAIAVTIVWCNEVVIFWFVTLLFWSGLSFPWRYFKEMFVLRSTKTAEQPLPTFLFLTVCELRLLEPQKGFRTLDVTFDLIEWVGRPRQPLAEGKQETKLLQLENSSEMRTCVRFGHLLLDKKFPIVATGPPTTWSQFDKRTLPVVCSSWVTLFLFLICEILNFEPTGGLLLWPQKGNCCEFGLIWHNHMRFPYFCSVLWCWVRPTSSKRINFLCSKHHRKNVIHILSTRASGFAHPKFQFYALFWQQ